MESVRTHSCLGCLYAVPTKSNGRAMDYLYSLREVYFLFNTKHDRNFSSYIWWFLSIIRTHASERLSPFITVLRLAERFSMGTSGNYAISGKDCRHRILSIQFIQNQTVEQCTIYFIVSSAPSRFIFKHCKHHRVMNKPDLPLQITVLPSLSSIISTAQHDVIIHTVSSLVIQFHTQTVFPQAPGAQ